MAPSLVPLCSSAFGGPGAYADNPLNPGSGTLAATPSLPPALCPLLEPPSAIQLGPMSCHPPAHTPEVGLLPHRARPTPDLMDSVLPKSPHAGLGQSPHGPVLSRAGACPREPVFQASSRGLPPWALPWGTPLFPFARPPVPTISPIVPSQGALRTPQTHCLSLPQAPQPTSPPPLPAASVLATHMPHRLVVPVGTLRPRPPAPGPSPGSELRY